MFIKSDLFIGFSLILFELRGRKLHSYLCFHGLEKGKTKIFFMETLWWINQYFFLLFLFPPKKTNQQNILGIGLWELLAIKWICSYPYSIKIINLITPCYLRAPLTMEPFWWKYSDGLNRNLNPFELNPSIHIDIWLIFSKLVWKL